MRWGLHTCAMVVDSSINGLVEFKWIAVLLHICICECGGILTGRVLYI